MTEDDGDRIDRQKRSFVGAARNVGNSSLSVQVKRGKGGMYLRTGVMGPVAEERRQIGQLNKPKLSLSAAASPGNPLCKDHDIDRAFEGIPPSLAAKLVKEGELEAFPFQPLEID